MTAMKITARIMRVMTRHMIIDFREQVGNMETSGLLFIFTFVSMSITSF